MEDTVWAAEAGCKRTTTETSERKWIQFGLPALHQAMVISFNFEVIYNLPFFSLEKDYNERPKYPELLAMPFMEQARNEKQFSMARFINEVND